MKSIGIFLLGMIVAVGLLAALGKSGKQDRPSLSSVRPNHKSQTVTPKVQPKAKPPAPNSSAVGKLGETPPPTATSVFPANKPSIFKDLFPPGQEGQDYSIKRTRGRLGVEVRAMTPEENEDNDLSGVGVVILKIKPDSAAEQAGLLAGDILLEVNRTPVGGVWSFGAIVLLQSPGVPVEGKICRDGSMLSKRIHFGDTLVPDTELQFNLSEMYSQGDGVSEDLAESIRLLRLAADGGNARAQERLGAVYYLGKGVEKDMTTAVRYLQLAAEQGQGWAQVELGQMYKQGDGVAQDSDKAFRYFQMAAKQDHAYGQFHLGEMYYKGLGIEKDREMAARYYQLAADQDHSDAQYIMGELYYDGDGVPKNRAQAVRWYKKAAAQGDHLAIKLLKNFELVDRLRKKD